MTFGVFVSVHEVYVSFTYGAPIKYTCTLAGYNTETNNNIVFKYGDLKRISTSVVIDVWSSLSSMTEQCKEKLENVCRTESTQQDVQPHCHYCNELGVLS